MADRTSRLKDLASVQARIRDLHEAKRASLLAQAQAAERDAEEIGRRSYGESSLSNLFPEVYANGVAAALRRRDEKKAAAEAEAALVRQADLRAERIREAWKQARDVDARATAERDVLEVVEQRLAR